MNQPLLYSRILQFSIVLSFLLPFFILGCQGKKSEETALGAIEVDTLTISSNKFGDSIGTEPKEAIDKDTTHQGSQNTNEKLDDVEKKPLSLKLADTYPALKPFLYSIIDEPTFEGISFTGIALLINALEYFIPLCFMMAFFLIILCVVLKFIDSLAVRTQLLINLLALLFLYIYIPGLEYKIRFGFWVCIALLVSTVMLDLYRLLIHKKRFA